MITINLSNLDIFIHIDDEALNFTCSNGNTFFYLKKHLREQTTATNFQDIYYDSIGGNDVVEESDRQQLEKELSAVLSSFSQKEEDHDLKKMYDFIHILATRINDVNREAIPKLLDYDYDEFMRVCTSARNIDKRKGIT